MTQSNSSVTLVIVRDDDKTKVYGCILRTLLTMNLALFIENACGVYVEKGMLHGKS